MASLGPTRLFGAADAELAGGVPTVEVDEQHSLAVFRPTSSEVGGQRRLAGSTLGAGLDDDVGGVLLRYCAHAPDEVESGDVQLKNLRLQRSQAAVQAAAATATSMSAPPSQPDGPK